VLAQLLGEEKQRAGKMLWVVGPALVHARAREDMVWFIQNGYGSRRSWAATPVAGARPRRRRSSARRSACPARAREKKVEGAALHMRAINAIRREGGISAAVKQGIVTAASCTRCDAGRAVRPRGSIRDDGPLPRS